MQADVEPLLQENKFTFEDAQTWVLLPLQIESCPVIETVGVALTMSILDIAEVQPFDAVPVTEYVPAVFTLIHAVVAPVFQI